jgi:hypothetical protein
VAVRVAVSAAAGWAGGMAGFDIELAHVLVDIFEISGMGGGQE